MTDLDRLDDDAPTPREGAPPGGTPVVLGDGRTYHLADFTPTLSAVWDRLWDHNCLRGRYDEADVRLAAWRLLEARYDVPPAAGADLIAGADLGALKDAVELALIGDDAAPTTWSDWVLESLLANAIDPASVPPERLRSVLRALVALGRARPPAEAITAARTAARVAEVRALAAAVARPTPTPAP
jgi:hypothetical protein